MKKKLTRKDFQIISRWTGNRLAGKENEVVYTIWTADGKKEVMSGFYRKQSAEEWLAYNIKIANKILSGEIKVEGYTI